MKQLTDEVFAQVRLACEYAAFDRPTLCGPALDALDNAQPVQVNAMLVEALQAAEKLEHEALVALSEATYELKVGNTYTTATDTYKANNDLIHRLDKILNSQYRDRKRAALTAAQQAQLDPFTPDWSQDSAAAESIREHQAICNLLLKEMRHIAGISTGQVKRVAEQALEAVKQAQPERAPLSIQEIADAWGLKPENIPASDIEAVREIEAAHGIGTEK